MPQCPRCAAPVSGEDATCPACGHTFGSAPPTPVSGRAFKGLARRPWHGGRSAAGSRFLPGTLLAGRFRLVSLLGRGGMGEVYRAEDLKLGQAVALKFLPEELARDGDALAHFHREVSFARQVSHPNVCRVFDVGEVDGQVFLTMELIDGEDLAYLLRRIGRLPLDKALQIARQLCSGLAAIHDAGVLHRDLKPSNVMIDGRGRARITDFGVAALARESSGPEEETAGTPAYMAPEQRARGEVGIRSDLYSLGLVLYEMFTGRRAFPQTPPADSSRPRSETKPARPSTLVPHLDPRIEGLILRCLARDPAARPSSALQLASLLPGADPLADAIAAGETPSPEMVAAAPEVGSLRRRTAVLCLLGILLALAAVLTLSDRWLNLHQLAFESSPKVLAGRARSLLQRLGHRLPPVDHAYGLQLNGAYDQYLRDRGVAGRAAEAEDLLAGDRPPLFWFWYRQSRRPMVALLSEVVTPDQPPLTTAGDALVILDTRGRLYRLAVTPRRLPGPASLDRPPDWAALLAEAGFDDADLRPVVPRWTPPVYADSVAAWEGVYPASPSSRATLPPVPIRIEAAAFRGVPVAFEIIEPWSAAPDPGKRSEPLSHRIFAVSAFVFFLCVLVTAAVLARRNVRLGRGDRQGGARLAAFVFLVTLGCWAIGGHHVSSREEAALLGMAITTALTQAAQLWIIYMGLEPPLRRHWPQRIISWSRLLSGSFRDPLVGRDLLVGCLLGLATVLLYGGEKMLTDRLGGDFAVGLLRLDSLLGPPGLARQLSFDVFHALLAPLSCMVFLLLLAILLRRERLAVALLWILITLVMAARYPNSLLLLGLAFSGVRAALHLFVWLRFGLFAGVAGQFVRLLCLFYPLTWDLSAWYAEATLFSTLTILTLALYGFAVSIGGQRLLRSNLVND